MLLVLEPATGVDFPELRPHLGPEHALAVAAGLAPLALVLVAVRVLLDPVPVLEVLLPLALVGLALREGLALNHALLPGLLLLGPIQRPARPRLVRVLVVDLPLPGELQGPWRPTELSVRHGAQLSEGGRHGSKRRDPASLS